MTIRSRLPAIVLAALLAGPALAQSPTPIRPGEPAISMDQARRIAAENGIVRVQQIELDDGKWEVEGHDAAGAKIEIDLRASDGMVIKMERDRPASASTRP